MTEAMDALAFLQNVELYDASEANKSGCKVKFYVPGSRSVLDCFETATVRRGKKAGHRYRMFVSSSDGEKTIADTESQLAGWTISHTQGAIIAFWLPESESLAPFKDKPVHASDSVGEQYIISLFELTDDDQLADPVSGRAISIKAKQEKGPYGKAVRALHHSGFFLAPKVLAEIGTDDQYQAWCREKPCAICGGGDWVEEKGELRCEFGHVRRSSAAGTAFKPLYSGVPLCNKHHSAQHDHGEYAASVGAHGIETHEEASRWFEKQRDAHLIRWAKFTLAGHFGHESMTWVSQEKLRNWATDRNIQTYLPKEYRL